MNTREIDILNIILIIVSLTLAFNVPFGAFIFSYAFLGPLHYLTEINWLKEKEYFVKNKSWVFLFVFFVFFITLPMLLKLYPFSTYSDNETVKEIKKFIIKTTDEIFIISLLFAIGLIYFKKKLHLILFLLLSITISFLFLNYFSVFSIGIAIFVPTLIHVYIFTLLFMIYGTINNKSTPGIIAILLLLFVPFIIYFSKIIPENYNNISNYLMKSFDDSGFGVIHTHIAKTFDDNLKQFSYLSVIGIKIQIFIAFAYVYHYLNWFSKTSIIGWNKKMTKRKIRIILFIWLFSVALYIYNFKIGIVALAFLSALNVFLEFPLNMTSIKGIVLKIRAQF